MKLREFVANSLPRVRGRKKKSQSQKQPSKERNDSNQTKCQISQKQCASVIYAEPNHRSRDLRGTPDVRPRNRHTISDIGSDTTQYDSCNEYQTSYLNTSLDETKYASKDGGGFLTEQEKTSLLIYSSDCEPHPITGRKSRSRIRTNPWLPSPSTSYTDPCAFPPGVTVLKHASSEIDEILEGRFYGEKDVFMETDLSPTTPGSTDSGFKSSISSDINVKHSPPHVNTFYEPKPKTLTKPEKPVRTKKKSSKILKTSESFDISRNFESLKERKLCIRSQTTVNIDCVSDCHDNGYLDKTKWPNRHDLSLASPPINSAKEIGWGPSQKLDSLQESRNNDNFEFELCVSDDLNYVAKQQEMGIPHMDVTKEVAVQTDFEDNDDSDWMTASSFDDTTEVSNRSPRKLSLTSDCMQESTDTGYSSLTRDGLLELDEDFQFYHNKENINGTLSGWLNNKEHFAVSTSMGQSWCEGSIGSIGHQGMTLNHMCQSWYEGSKMEHIEIPFSMTSSMYIPEDEVKSFKDPLAESVARGSSRIASKNESNRQYVPVLEYGPVIRKPGSEKKKSTHDQFRKRSDSSSSESYVSPLNSPCWETKKILGDSASNVENTSPLATSTPTDDKSKTDITHYRNKADILSAKSQNSPMSRAGRPRSKKAENRKPRDNLDVIRDYLGYASFEDFYFAKKCPPLSTGRTLNQIKSSLEEKVDQLRQEKLIVEQKIQEAQEEERIKKHEKLKFQKQLHYHRKQLLIQTLHDLKEKLENQSDRLQKSYSTILNLQSKFSHRQSSFTLMRAGPM
ncbi:hypothetical protein LOTGIDRAFT_171465 [Lottia gigantea]|uniref:Uncharacterized protein n=1 Tax=Lottia gigantea TaxID=225164 RepID=V4AH83_LOTGI|nr:hypothetical protein LOTGIDRAFT_171465 [Lottia gigantea]ESP03379.1 hypothetical protein LOTGIDRAFT_171465 [Lottia gigantea]